VQHVHSSKIPVWSSCLGENSSFLAIEVQQLVDCSKIAVWSCCLGLNSLFWPLGS